MKQFSLDEYLANPSKKIITRDGRAVKIICIDAKGSFPVIGLVADAVTDVSSESPISFTTNGSYWNAHNYENSKSPLDLFFASEKHEGWINIFKTSNNIAVLGQSSIFESKEDAEKNGKDCECYVATIKIEWEG